MISTKEGGTALRGEFSEILLDYVSICRSLMRMEKANLKVEHLQMLLGYAVEYADKDNSTDDEVAKMSKEFAQIVKLIVSEIVGERKSERNN